MKFPVERLDSSQADQVFHLSHLLGWDYSPEEIRFILQSGTVFGHRNETGQVISTAAVFAYETWASLGMVMVHPEYRRIGLASQLVKQCMVTEPEKPFMLVATNEGKPLYEKLCFRTVATVHKLVTKKAESIRIPSPPLEVKEIDPINIDPILALDVAAFGDRRTMFLKNRITHASFGYVLYNSSDHVIGFALGIRNGDQLIVGPVAAWDQEAAAVLIGQLLRRHSGPARIDIPSGHQNLIRLLTTAGFEIVRIPPVMTTGGTPLPSRQHLFALASQAFG